MARGMPAGVGEAVVAVVVAAGPIAAEGVERVALRLGEEASARASSADQQLLVLVSEALEKEEGRFYAVVTFGLEVYLVWNIPLI